MWQVAQVEGAQFDTQGTADMYNCRYMTAFRQAFTLDTEWSSETKQIIMMYLHSKIDLEKLLYVPGQSMSRTVLGMCANLASVYLNYAFNYARRGGEECVFPKMHSIFSHLCSSRERAVHRFGCCTFAFSIREIKT